MSGSLPKFIWSIIYTFPKFDENPPITVWVILLIYRQTNTGQNITSPPTCGECNELMSVRVNIEVELTIKVAPLKPQYFMQLACWSWRKLTQALLEGTMQVNVIKWSLGHNVWQPKAVYLPKVPYLQPKKMAEDRNVDDCSMFCRCLFYDCSVLILSTSCCFYVLWLYVPVFIYIVSCK